MEQGTIEGYYRGTIYRYPCSLPGLRKAACARSTWFCSPGAVGGPIQLRTWATFLVARGAIRPTTGPETNASRGTCDHVLPRSPSRGPAMAAASMESCRFVARRSPGGRFSRRRPRRRPTIARLGAFRPRTSPRRRALRGAGHFTNGRSARPDGHLASSAGGPSFTNERRLAAFVRRSAAYDERPARRAINKQSYTIGTKPAPEHAPTRRRRAAPPRADPPKRSAPSGVFKPRLSRILKAGRSWVRCPEPASRERASSEAATAVRAVDCALLAPLHRRAPARRNATP